MDGPVMQTLLIADRHGQDHKSKRGLVSFIYLFFFIPWPFGAFVLFPCLVLSYLELFSLSLSLLLYAHTFGAFSHLVSDWNIYMNTYIYIVYTQLARENDNKKNETREITRETDERAQHPSWACQLSKTLSSSCVSLVEMPTLTHHTLVLSFSVFLVFPLKNRYVYI